jgi:gentisate 1,2-dioxygenase
LKESRVMSASDLTSDEAKLEALHRRMEAHSLGGHWQARERNQKLVPVLWRWQTIEPCLMEAAEIVKLGHVEEANNRRTINLVNPSLAARKSTSRTLQMSVQLVNPGESAEAHRHTPAAIRFVVEGDGIGYTNVEGEQMLMEAGDLILTPNWTWHDHVNPGKKKLIWLDVLDVHMVNVVDAMTFESYPGAPGSNAPFQPVVKPDGDSRRRLGALRARGAGATPDGRALPYAYKWRDTLAALEEMAASGAVDPHDAILLEYANPLTGGPTLPTFTCCVQYLAPGIATRAQRHTGSAIYHVVRGAGATRIGAEELVWGARDCFFVPSMEWHSFANRSPTEPAILFSVTDRPVLESLGLYREEKG